MFKISNKTVDSILGESGYAPFTRRVDCSDKTECRSGSIDPIPRLSAQEER